MVKLKIATIFSFCCAALLFACKHDPEVLPPIPEPPAPCSDSANFVDDVWPIISSRCAMSGCHNEATEDNEETDLTSYSSIMQYVIANNPSDSDLWERIMEEDSDEVMPKPGSTPLTEEEKAIILQWINEGARNNSCSECDTTFQFSADIFPIIQTNCSGCHDGNNPDTGLSLLNYDNITAAVSYSNLMNRINGIGGYMPPSNHLQDCVKDQIQKWVDAGMPNN
jgi:hypothetical protein